VQIQIKILHSKAKLPAKKTIGASGYDLYAAIDESICIHPGKAALIPTGISLAIPFGYEMQVRPRSGISYERSLLILNTPGTIDSDYRGEIFVPVFNLGNSSFKIESGLRIAQLVLSKIETIEWAEVESLEPTFRGEKGFGSSGKF